MTTALARCGELWPGAEIERQPHNNPGFDIRVGPADDVVRFVEVKGTTMPRPAFFLSEGERRFSVANAERYTALIVHSIDLARGAYELYRHDGAIAPSVFTLSTRQWQCEVAGGGTDAAATG